MNQASAPALSLPIACNTCHVVPSTNGHANGAIGVTYAGLAVAQGAAPLGYDTAAHTCSNTYCHGNFPGGNRSAAALSWATSGKLSCTACHAAPPPLNSTTHHPANTACATCHGTGYTGTTVVASTHVDGATTLSRSGCTLCHGDLTQTAVAATSGRYGSRLQCNLGRHHRRNGGHGCRGRRPREAPHRDSLARHRARLQRVPHGSRHG